MKTPKTRAELKFFEPKESSEFDYSSEITDEKMQSMDKAMMHKSGLSGVELHEKLNEGILVSGEEW